jgi:hypothetical protein
MTEQIGKYLDALLMPGGPKTSRWRIVSRTQRTVLGVVQWFPRWRQYCFDPSGMTTFNAECLDDIARFLRRVMHEHRNAGAVEKRDGE